MWSIQPVVQSIRRDVSAGIAAPASTLLDGLISYWKLDEASGIAVDSVGSNTLTDNNTVTSAAGQVGSSRQFTLANSEYLSIASNASLQAGDIDFTISAWINATTFAASGNAVVAKQSNNGDTGIEYILFVDNSNTAYLAVRIAGSTKLVTKGGLTTGTWFHLIAWHDSIANTINIQVNDGTLASVATTASLVSVTTAEFRIGARALVGNEIYFNGQIDDVKFWKRVLTIAERTEDYQNGLAGIPLL